MIGNTCEGYITVGLYEDGMPGEIFVVLSKEGAEISGLVDSFATAISIGLQYGVPLKVLVNKYIHANYEPSGPTQNPNIPHARSIVDYIFRWLAHKFLTAEERHALGLHNAGATHEQIQHGAVQTNAPSMLRQLEPDQPSF